MAEFILQNVKLAKPTRMSRMQGWFRQAVSILTDETDQQRLGSGQASATEECEPIKLGPHGGHADLPTGTKGEPQEAIVSSMASGLATCT